MVKQTLPSETSNKPPPPKVAEVRDLKASFLPQGGVSLNLYFEILKNFWPIL